MTPAELGKHAQRRLRQFHDSRRAWDSIPLDLESTGGFPRLPPREETPAVLREALQRDTVEILAGRWKAFGHLDLNVDDPPRWHRDYLAGQDLATSESCFQLDHRKLPEGADIKLIWELSRWHQLVRLAMASYVLGDETARSKCIQWLEDWVVHNPPYRGWNWTSALEAGMRLVQFTWIDALLTAAPEGRRQLKTLRDAILPPHIWYVWRHRSFGSSANNHLLGELAGCILATVRWPRLAEVGAPLTALQACWEGQVSAQFAEDGGNREQALNYHLFSFEFCWYTLKALEAAGCSVSGSTRQRLASAARFFRDIQATSEPWDYGDSDSAFVTPLFATDAVTEWHRWVEEPSAGAISYWLGDSPRSPSSEERGTRIDGAEASGWRVYAQSGIAVCRADPWWLRWDLSSLGYLSTAAHGHLDALHLSLWFRGVAMVIDPGTGAYYPDPKLRDWLSSRAAHNGPRPEGMDQPRRLGPFLWAEHHPMPRFEPAGATGWAADLDLWGTRLRRRITIGNGPVCEVDDECHEKDGRTASFTVRWQFAPASMVRELPERRFSLERGGESIVIQISEGWAAATLGEGIVSPAFRKTCRAPFLELTARSTGDPHSRFRTTFLAGARP